MTEESPSMVGTLGEGILRRCAPQDDRKTRDDREGENDESLVI